MTSNKEMKGSLQDIEQTLVEKERVTNKLIDLKEQWYRRVVNTYCKFRKAAQALNKEFHFYTTVYQAPFPCVTVEDFKFESVNAEGVVVWVWDYDTEGEKFSAKISVPETENDADKLVQEWQENKRKHLEANKAVKVALTKMERRALYNELKTEFEGDEDVISNES